MYLSHKIYFKHEFRTLHQEQRWWHWECFPCLTVTYNVSTVDLNNIEQSHRYSIESVRNRQGGDIWTGFNNHSLAIQKASIFPSFTDFRVRLHLKKWPCYIKSSSSGYQRETNKWRTFEVNWTYRLVSHISWTQWGLKLKFEKVSIFQKQALNLWRRRGWYKHTN